jgi:hypothetical protein
MAYGKAVDAAVQSAIDDPVGTALDFPCTVRRYESTRIKWGNLTRSKYWPELHEWRLTDQELARARRDWEDSELVLAAEREPFRWQ